MRSPDGSTSGLPQVSNEDAAGLRRSLPGSRDSHDERARVPPLGRELLAHMLAEPGRESGRVPKGVLHDGFDTTAPRKIGQIAAGWSRKAGDLPQAVELLGPVASCGASRP